MFIAKVIADLKNAAFIGIMIDKSMFINLAEYVIVFAMYVKAGELHSRILKLKCLHDQNAEGVVEFLTNGVSPPQNIQVNKSCVPFSGVGAHVQYAMYRHHVQKCSVCPKRNSHKKENKVRPLDQNS